MSKSSIIINATLIFINIIILYLLISTISSFFSAYCNADIPSYIDAAKRLYLEGFRANSIRTFGFPLLLGFPILFGYKTDIALIHWMIGLNTLFWVLTIMLLSDILSNIQSLKHINRFFIYVMLFSVGHLTLIFQAITEISYVFFLVLCAWAFLKFHRSQNNTYLLISFFALCYSTVIRPTMIYFSIPILIYVLWQLKSKPIKNTITVLSIYALTIGLQYFIMYKEYKQFQFTYLADIGLNYYFWMYADEVAKSGDIAQISKRWWDRMVVEVVQDYQVPNYDIRTQHMTVMHRLKQSLMENPRSYAITFLRNLASNSLGGTTGILQIEDAGYHNLIYKCLFYFSKLYNLIAVTSTFIFIPAYLFFKKSFLWKNSIFLLCFVVSLWIILISAINSTQGDRYHIVIYPYIIICWALIIQEYHDKYHHSKL
ncbi:MAG: hypothetical protein KA010_01115 [Saprospiraceae bacterium]|nr:hypothetical protein [Saprospiraceae bacterium]